MGTFPASFSFISFFWKQFFPKEIVDFTRFQTRIVGTEGKHADHLTITTAPRELDLFEKVRSMIFLAKSVYN